jgi:hypothetical protein
MAAQPLRIAAFAQGDATGWRRGQDLIDALPYLDDISAAEKQQVDALIEEEMRRSSKRPGDYLKELPPVPEPNYRGQEAIEKELERCGARPAALAPRRSPPAAAITPRTPAPASSRREPDRAAASGRRLLLEPRLLPPTRCPRPAARRVKAGAPMAALDTNRFSLPKPPANKQNDYNAWKHAVDNAHSQIEHQHLRCAPAPRRLQRRRRRRRRRRPCCSAGRGIPARARRRLTSPSSFARPPARILNLELLLKYGPNAWRAHNQALDAASAQLQAQLAGLRDTVDGTNRERKLQQEAAGARRASPPAWPAWGRCGCGALLWGSSDRPAPRTRLRS